MNAQQETLTITLTDRAPVKIKKDAWPVLASGSAHDGRELECQSTRTWRLTVRTKGDRAIVYGAYTSRWQGESDRRGGEILDGDTDYPAAIRRVGESLDMPAQVIADCIADLPAEEI